MEITDELTVWPQGVSQVNWVRLQNVMFSQC